MQADTPIPFVHDYCDRWCERCRLVARCPIGARELERARLPSTPEQEAAELAATLQRAVAMLEAACIEEGLDPSDQDTFDPVVLEDPMLVYARFWAGTAFAWVEHAGPEPALAELTCRYAILVPAKLTRALMSADESEEPDPRSDAMGSAKVATLALHDVLSGLADHLTLRPLDLRAHQLAADTLSLIEDIEDVLPGHLAFHRPGFDDPEATPG